MLRPDELGRSRVVCQRCYGDIGATLSYTPSHRAINLGRNPSVVSISIYFIHLRRYCDGYCCLRAPGPIRVLIYSRRLLLLLLLLLLLFGNVTGANCVIVIKLHHTEQFRSGGVSSGGPNTEECPQSVRNCPTLMD